MLSALRSWIVAAALFVGSTTVAGDVRVLDVIEDLEKRDAHTRVFDVVEELDRTDETTGTRRTSSRRSRVVKKGGGICYRDTAGEWRAADPRWRRTGDVFVVDEAAYSLETGQTFADGLAFTIRGMTLAFAPAGIAFVDGDNELPVCPVPLAVIAVADGEDPRRVIFDGAYSPDIDAELVVACDGLHQNLVLRSLPDLPVGLDLERTRVVVRTVVDIGSLLDAGVEVNIAGKLVDLGSAEETAWVEVGQILFALDREPLFWFADSLVLGADRTSATAARRLRRDPSTGVWFLEESLSATYFARPEVFPVVWDPPLVRSGMITVNSVWPSGATIHVVGTVTVGTGYPTSSPAVLTIEPDCRVKIDYGHEVVIGTGGQVMAKGELLASARRSAARILASPG